MVHKMFYYPATCAKHALNSQGTYRKRNSSAKKMAPFYYNNAAVKSDHQFLASNILDWVVATNWNKKTVASWSVLSQKWFRGRLFEALDYSNWWTVPYHASVREEQLWYAVLKDFLKQWSYNQLKQSWFTIWIIQSTKLT